MPDHSFWRRSVSSLKIDDFDPIVSDFPIISANTKIGTGGSCFAQNISSRLNDNGFTYLVTERGPSVLSDECLKISNYGVFSARYGNIYTAAQLVQLFDRAYFRFDPSEVYWQEDDGCVVDPFRPQIQPGGFSTVEEMLIDRKQHLESVRQLFEQLDVFIFTLGLTEGWRDKRDGAVFPICPGCSGGAYDPLQHEFVNFSYPEVYGDMVRFAERLATVNVDAKIIVTVSPVPLIATASGNHVATATSYSKSVLRAVAGDLSASLRNVSYFPSYEIFTMPFMGGAYFSSDRRSVQNRGVDHAMRVFFSHICETPDSSKKSQTQIPLDESDKIAAVICDEEILDSRASQ